MGRCPADPARFPLRERLERPLALARRAASAALNGQQPSAEQELVIRPATERDAELLLRWRNDPRTNRDFFGDASVAYDDHVRWLRRKLGEPDACRLWIAELDGEPVGQARVDRTAGSTGEISVSIAPERRGRGVGRRLIEAATARALDELRLEAVHALVKVENVASLAAFRRAGYADVLTDESGEPIVRLIRTRP